MRYLFGLVIAGLLLLNHFNLVVKEIPAIPVAEAHAPAIKSTLNEVPNGIELGVNMPRTPHWAPARPQLFMAVEGGVTSQPIGHFDYCKSNGDDCAITTKEPERVVYSQSMIDSLTEYNIAVNKRIQPQTEMECNGVEELWTLVEGEGSCGDCDDFMLTKRKELMENGWPASALLFTTVKQQNGEGHAVLTLVTTSGDFILDNQKNEILPWWQTDYKYLKRQKATHSGQWEDIIDQRASIRLASAN